MSNGTESPPPGGTPPPAPVPPARPGPGRTIAIAVASMVAGGILMRVLDRTVFNKEKDEEDDLDMFAESKPRKALAPAPAPVPAPIPRPQIIRVELPRGQRMPEEFWKRLAGGNEDGGYFDE